MQNNTGLKDFLMGIVLQSIYSVSKELNIPPLSAKCTIAQVRRFKKMEKLEMYYL